MHWMASAAALRPSESSNDSGYYYSGPISLSRGRAIKPVPSMMLANAAVPSNDDAEEDFTLDEDIEFDEDDFEVYSALIYRSVLTIYEGLARMGRAAGKSVLAGHRRYR